MARMTSVNTSIVLARLDERTEKIAESVDQLTHVLLTGNGSPPITTSVATQGVQLTAINARLTAIEHAPEVSGRLAGGDKYMVWAALVSGLFTLLEMLYRHAH